MKKCPFCAEEIQDEAIKCRYCQSFLSSAPPAAAERAGSEPAVAAAAARPAPAPVIAEPDKPAEPKSPLLNRAAGTDEPTPAAGGRKVLYAGSPSWRAFIGQYTLIVLGALIVPFISYWFAGKVDASGFSKFLAILIPLLIAVGAFFAVNFYRKSKIYRVTTTNIENEYGILSKRIDVLELWRCRDVRYEQSLMDRILGIAHIEVFTADVTTPQLCMVGLPASRQLFERVRDSIEIQRQARNVVGFVE